MEQTSPNKGKQGSDSKGYLFYSLTRITVGMVAIIAVLWFINALINLNENGEKEPAAVEANRQAHAAKVQTANLNGSATSLPPAEHAEGASTPADSMDQPPATAHDIHAPESEDNLLKKLGLTTEAAKGVTFVSALIVPLSHELHDRWWGWRPNDLIKVTDNVNNFQVGTLELTRRTTVILTDRISRTSSADALNKHLENAMNAFMISADRYWFPSAESKYKEGLEELEAYKNNLEKGQANFYNRTDNLIPLLRSFEDLLGSCDENLVKSHEADGSKVSHFKADDYFYYAKGVASGLHTILQAVLVDYQQVLEVRRATDDLHQAIESLHHAMQIDPLYVTNADLSGILANHRANIAATISHAQSYLQVVITALST